MSLLSFLFYVYKNKEHKSLVGGLGKPGWFKAK